MKYLSKNPCVMGGQLCLKGHRISITQVIEEISDSSIEEFSEDFEIEEGKVRGALYELVALASNRRPKSGEIDVDGLGFEV